MQGRGSSTSSGRSSLGAFLCRPGWGVGFVSHVFVSVPPLLSRCDAAYTLVAHAACPGLGPPLAVVPVEEEQGEGAHHQEEEDPHSEAGIVFDGLSNVLIAFFDVFGRPDNQLVDAVNLSFLL